VRIETNAEAVQLRHTGRRIDRVIPVILTLIAASAMLPFLKSLPQIVDGMISARAGRGRPGVAQAISCQFSD
jgi:hypothetical protein